MKPSLPTPKLPPSLLSQHLPYQLLQPRPRNSLPPPIDPYQIPERVVERRISNVGVRMSETEGGKIVEEGVADKDGVGLGEEGFDGREDLGEGGGVEEGKRSYVGY